MEKIENKVTPIAKFMEKIIEKMYNVVPVGKESNEIKLQAVKNRDLLLQSEIEYLNLLKNETNKSQKSKLAYKYLVGLIYLGEVEKIEKNYEESFKIRNIEKNFLLNNSSKESYYDICIVKNLICEELETMNYKELVELTTDIHEFYKETLSKWNNQDLKNKTVLTLDLYENQLNDMYECIYQKFVGVIVLGFHSLSAEFSKFLEPVFPIINQLANLEEQEEIKKSNFQQKSLMDKSNKERFFSEQVEKAEEVCKYHSMLLKLKNGLNNSTNESIVECLYDFVRDADWENGSNDLKLEANYNIPLFIDLLKELGLDKYKLDEGKNLNKKINFDVKELIKSIDLKIDELNKEEEYNQNYKKELEQTKDLEEEAANKEQLNQLIKRIDLLKKELFIKIKKIELEILKNDMQKCEKINLLKFLNLKIETFKYYGIDINTLLNLNWEEAVNINQLIKYIDLKIDELNKDEFECNKQRTEELNNELPLELQNVLKQAFLKLNQYKNYLETQANSNIPLMPPINLSNMPNLILVKKPNLTYQDELETDYINCFLNNINERNSFSEYADRLKKLEDTENKTVVFDPVESLKNCANIAPEKSKGFDVDNLIRRIDTKIEEINREEDEYYKEKNNIPIEEIILQDNETFWLGIDDYLVSCLDLKLERMLSFHIDKQEERNSRNLKKNMLYFIKSMNNKIEELEKAESMYKIKKLVEPENEINSKIPAEEKNTQNFDKFYLISRIDAKIDELTKEEEEYNQNSQKELTSSIDLEKEKENKEKINQLISRMDAKIDELTKEEEYNQNSQKELTSSIDLEKEKENKEKIDQLISRMDAKIDELTKEEEEYNQNSQKELTSSIDLEKEKENKEKINQLISRMDAKIDELTKEEEYNQNSQKELTSSIDLEKEKENKEKIDQLISRMDAKIDELTKEEEEYNQNSQKELTSSIEVNNNDAINQLINLIDEKKEKLTKEEEYNQNSQKELTSSIEVNNNDAINQLINLIDEKKEKLTKEEEYNQNSQKELTSSIEVNNNDAINQLINLIDEKKEKLTKEEEYNQNSQKELTSSIEVNNNDAINQLINLIDEKKEKLTKEEEYNQNSQKELTSSIEVNNNDAINQLINLIDEKKEKLTKEEEYNQNSQKELTSSIEVNNNDAINQLINLIDEKKEKLTKEEEYNQNSQKELTSSIEVNNNDAINQLINLIDEKKEKLTKEEEYNQNSQKELTSSIEVNNNDAINQLISFIDEKKEELNGD